MKMGIFDPMSLQRRFSVVLDYVKGETIQVYPAERLPRIPGVKLLGEVLAFDHSEAQRKALRQFSSHA